MIVMQMEVNFFIVWLRFTDIEFLYVQVILLALAYDLALGQ
jgi:hypothetical protein